MEESIQLLVETKYKCVECKSQKKILAIYPKEFIHWCYYCLKPTIQEKII